MLERHPRSTIPVMPKVRTTMPPNCRTTQHSNQHLHQKPFYLDWKGRAECRKTGPIPSLNGLPSSTPLRLYRLRRRRNSVWTVYRALTKGKNAAWTCPIAAILITSGTAGPYRERWLAHPTTGRLIVFQARLCWEHRLRTSEKIASSNGHQRANLFFQARHSGRFGSGGTLGARSRREYSAAPARARRA
jgi:hypothetical protein